MVRVIVVAPLWLPIPPAGYGGIERQVHSLVNGLVERGHEVTLYAPGDTESRAQTLRAVTPLPLRRQGVEWTDINYNLIAAAKALREAEDDDYDAICFSVERPYYLAAMSLSTRPTFFTLHGVWTTDTQPKSEVDMLMAFRSANFVSISHSQQRAMPQLNYIANVYNGIEVADHPFTPQGAGYAVWLGRLEAEKGAHVAIAAARAIGIKLVLAGPQRLETAAGRDYFEAEIRPHLGPDVEFIGELEHEAKVKLLGEASVMINPYVYQEAFGYATVEALACGTPVVVPSWGAGPELIEEGVSGYSAANLDDWVRATERALSLDRRACRERAEFFDVSRMIDGYEDAFRTVIRGAGVGQVPRAVVEEPPLLSVVGRRA